MAACARARRPRRPHPAAESSEPSSSFLMLANHSCEPCARACLCPREGPLASPRSTQQGSACACASRAEGRERGKVERGHPGIRAVSMLSLPASPAATERVNCRRGGHFTPKEGGVSVNSGTRPRPTTRSRMAGAVSHRLRPSRRPHDGTAPLKGERSASTAARRAAVSALSMSHASTPAVLVPEGELSRERVNCRTGVPAKCSASRMAMRFARCAWTCASRRPTILVFVSVFIFVCICIVRAAVQSVTA